MSDPRRCAAGTLPRGEDFTASFDEYARSWSRLVRNG